MSTRIPKVTVLLLILIPVVVTSCFAQTSYIQCAINDGSGNITEYGFAVDESSNPKEFRIIGIDTQIFVGQITREFVDATATYKDDNGSVFYDQYKINRVTRVGEIYRFALANNVKTPIATMSGNCWSIAAPM